MWILLGMKKMNNYKKDHIRGSKFQRKPGNPLYLQIKTDLLTRIVDGQWSENTLIPTEAELCEEYGVSTVTIREALKLLVQDGVLRRIAGKGTFVTKPKLEQKLNNLVSITRWAKQEGLSVTTRIIKIEKQKCDSSIAYRLSVPKGKPVTRVERLRLGNAEPLMFEVLWIPTHYCPDLHVQDMANTPFYDILTHVYHIPLTRAVETIEPALADQYTTELLGVGRKALFLLVEHTAYTLNDEVAYFVRSFYRGDRYKFSIEVKTS